MHIPEISYPKIEVESTTTSPATYADNPPNCMTCLGKDESHQGWM